MQGCESELPGEKVAVSRRGAGPQPDSTEDRRSTMLERHSRLEAPDVLSAKLSTGFPKKGMIAVNAVNI